AEVRKAEVIPYLRPDGKTQVTVRYENDRPVEIVKLLISTQHRPGIDGETLIKQDLWEHVVEPVLHEEYKELFTEKELYAGFLVNPTGKFEIGGPMGDAGLTGRKVIVDTYGGAARHGGGAFSGKDPSKVDRSAAYAARYVAKNVVAAGLADRCEIQVAYAIGVAHPVSVMVETYGTERVDKATITRLIGEHPPRLLAYSWRRFLRIFPAYWVALTLVALVFGLPGLFGSSDVPLFYGLAQTWKQSTIGAGLSQAWTLCIEITFYAFLPLWAWAMRSVRGRDFDTRLRGEVAGLA